VIQKVEQHLMSTTLSNPSGVPLIEGKKDERETWSTSYLHLPYMRDGLNRSTPAWSRTLHRTQGGPGMGSADHSTTPCMGTDIGQCEYCETRQGPFEVHHIRRMKDVAQKKGLWQKMMAARYRKTLVLCRRCHHLLHEGKLPDKAVLQAQVKGEPCTVKAVRTVRREGDG
jgi:hypothetical protein